ncbi:MAG: hypothetical protein RLZZ562_2074, partial [Planctomycetota bacterium]
MVGAKAMQRFVELQREPFILL